MGEREHIKQAIAALEGQRAVLGDAAVQTALLALRQQLEAMASSEEPTRAQPSLAASAGERKLVTVMFADLSGFTALSEDLDPESVREVVNACFNRLTPVIEKYQGTVDKFIGDEIMALFGAPVARENDAERALRAALEMMDVLGAFNAERGTDLGMHVGVNTGMVIAGGLGSDGREQYTVMGDAVNLAARLKDLASRGQIIVGEDTYRQALDAFEFEPLEPVSVKGKSKPVSACRLLQARSAATGDRGASGLRSPLVGREGELGKITDALNALRRARGGVIAVIGEAGLGKSRLIAEARQRCGEGIQWAEGRAVSYGQGITYSVARDMLCRLLGENPEAPPDAIAAALERSIEDGPAEWAQYVYPYLGRMLGVSLDADAQGRLEDLEPNALKSRTQAAFAEIIRARARREPQALVWEDLHWADPSSLGLLEELQSLVTDQPVLLVFVFRLEGDAIEGFHARAAELLHEHYLPIQLAPLSTEQSGQLAKNLLRMGTLPDEARKLILDKVEGNPFFLEEVLRSLLDAGVVAFSDGRLVESRNLREIDVPDTLHAVIAARVDRLSSDDKKTLQTASVVGRVFQQRVIDRMLEPERATEQIDRSLDELRRREFVRLRLPKAFDPEYIFKHVLTQEVTYSTLLIAQRKALHRVAGEAIEALFPDRMDELAATLAYHFERADRPQKAVEYLTSAIARARASFANAEAIAFCRRAIAQTTRLLDEDAGQRDKWQRATLEFHENLGDVLNLSGKHEEARRAFLDMMKNVPEWDRISRSRIHWKIAKTWQEEYKFDRAFEAYDEAEASLGADRGEWSSGFWQAWIEVQINRMWSYYWRVQVDALAECIEKVRPAIEKYGTPLQQSGFYGCIIMLALRRDRYVISDETLKYSQMCLAFAHTAGKLGQVAMQKFMRGFVLLWRGDLQDAEQHLQEAEALSDRTGDMLLRVRCLAYLGVVCRMSGRPAEVLDFARRTLDVAESLNMPEYVGAAQANLAWVAWRNGKPAEVRTKVRLAMESWKESPAVYPFVWLALFPLIEADFADKNTAAAVNSVRELLQPERQRLPDVLMDAAEKAVAAWDDDGHEKADDAVSRIVELAASLGYM